MEMEVDESVAEGWKKNKILEKNLAKESANASVGSILRATPFTLHIIIWSIFNIKILIDTAF